jgi:hypothetical protein
MYFPVLGDVLEHLGDIVREGAQASAALRAVALAPGEYLIGVNFVAPRDAGDRSTLDVRLLDDLPHRFQRVLPTRPRAPAEAIGDYGIVCGGGHLAPTWTPRCARQDIIGTPGPGWLCGQNQTLTL